MISRLLQISVIVALIALAASLPAPWDQFSDDEIVAYLHRKDRCTAIAVAPKASTDGSAMATHTNDCHDCDFRVSLVPAKSHAKGAKRDIAPARFQYPRYLGFGRGSALTPERLTDKQYPWPLTASLGKIDQPKQTYAYLDGSYALVNEKQVGIGESTCSGRLINKPIFDGGQALFDVSELSRLALERASTAREAIQLMGDLAVKYGYYGAEWKGPGMYGEAGEALMVTDPKEAWVFHILPDGTDTSAVWVAARVPDNHIAVVANEFIIGEINLKDKKNFMGSDNIYDVAIKNKFWDKSQGAFNWRKVYSQPTFRTHRSYSDRRNWRVMDLVTPSRGFNSNSTLDDLPFSIKPDALISAADLFRIQRDHYEGTEFDLTKGLAAGPWGNPNRYDAGLACGVPGRWLMEGNFERAISIHRTAYSIVTQARGWLPNEIGGMVWFGPAQPHGTIYVPLYASAHRIARAFEEGSHYKWNKNSAWWAFTSVENWSERAYKWITQDIQAAQKEMEPEIFGQQLIVETDAVKLYSAGMVEEARGRITDWAEDTAVKTVETWWNLWEHLLAKYKDGSRLDDFHTQTIQPNPYFYPLEWLKAVGFWPSDMDFNHPSIINTNAMDAVNMNALASTEGEMQTERGLGFYAGMGAVFIGVFSVGVLSGRVHQRKSGSPALL